MIQLHPTDHKSEKSVGHFKQKNMRCRYVPSLTMSHPQPSSIDGYNVVENCWPQADGNPDA